MIKNYILDTNVLLHDPDSLTSFEENQIIIPYPVLEELDKHKTDAGSLGYSARKVIRELDNPPPKVKVIFETELPEIEGFDNEKMDNVILRYVNHLAGKLNDPVVLVTKDVAFRVKGRLLGLDCQDYEKDKHKANYKGYKKGKVNQDVIRQLLQGSVDCDRAKINNVFPNQYIVYPNVIAKYTNETLIPVKAETVSGIKPLNDQQVMAVDALLDPEVALVTLTGQAGTGKTLLAIAAGLEQNYSRILVSKPTVPMGRDIGFLPGNEREKMDVWVQPIYDNIELISSFQREPLEEIMEQLSVTALTFMRGRSIPNQFIIVDEAQNLSPHEVKTIVTRVGENSKLVFTGDIEQIDSPYLDKESNGLTYLINKFKKEPIAAHVNLIQGERSELASLGAKLL